MRVALSSGEAEVKIIHTELDLVRSARPFSKMSEYRDEYTRCRATIIEVVLADGRRIEGRSVCKPPDQFSRREGRLRAMRRLAATLRADVGGFPLMFRPDRQLLFAKLHG